MDPLRKMASSMLFEPADVNRTEVECTRIREAEATKRVRVEQKALNSRVRVAQVEETRRDRIKARGDGWVVPWFVAGVTVVALCLAGGISYSSWLGAAYPDSHPSCQETTEIISVSNSERRCPAGAWSESRAVGGEPGQVLALCHCGPHPTSPVISALAIPVATALPGSN